jgi:glucosyl-dolichyl phosphate glucuronosyltransferase
MKMNSGSEPDAEGKTADLVLSAIIPTKNRSCELAAVIRDLLNQTLLPSEIVVIDQSANDTGRCLVMNLFDGVPQAVRESVRLRYVLDTSISGLSTARNHSMDIVAGDVWLFLDDDVELEKNFLEEIIAVFRERPRVAAVGGMITNYAPPPLPFRLWTRVFALGPFHDERQPIYWHAGRLRDSGPIDVRKLTGAAMAFRADAVRGLRFDPNLTGYSLAEDVDFAARIQPGIIVVAPRARLVHKRSPAGRATDHWLRGQAQSSYYLYRRNWRQGLPNRLRFLWLNVGHGLAVALCCLKRQSLQPLSAFLEGIRRGREASNFRRGFA